MNVGAFVLVLVATSLVALSAGATPSARLTYVRGPGAESCPDESGLRKAVAARLGYDPFFGAAPKTVVAEIRAGAPPKRGFRGVVQIIDENGIVRGERALETASGDCTEMVKALALGISIAIDDLDAISPPSRGADEAPAAAPRAESEAAVTAPIVTTPAVPAERPPPAPPSDADALRLLLSAGGRGSLGLGPAPSAGISVGVGAVRGAYSLRAEASAELPAEDRLTSGGSVRTSFLAASVLPCLRLGVPIVCGSASAGSFRGGAVGIASPHAESAFFAMAGARVGVLVPITSALALAPHADVAVPLLRHGVAVDGRTVFTTPPIGASLGLDVQVELF